MYLFLFALLVQEHVIHLQFLFCVIGLFRIHYNVVYDDFRSFYDALKKNKNFLIILDDYVFIPKSSGEGSISSSIDFLARRSVRILDVLGEGIVDSFNLIIYHKNKRKILKNQATVVQVYLDQFLSLLIHFLHQ